MHNDNILLPSSVYVLLGTSRMPLRHTFTPLSFNLPGLTTSPWPLPIRFISFSRLTVYVVRFIYFFTLIFLRSLPKDLSLFCSNFFLNSELKNSVFILSFMECSYKTWFSSTTVKIFFFNGINYINNLNK